VSALLAGDLTTRGVVLFIEPQAGWAIVRRYHVSPSHIVASRTLHVVDHMAQHTHDEQPQLICAGCVRRLWQRSLSCTRCTAEVAVLIDDELAHRLDGIAHDTACEALRSLTETSA
jgi:hypothetical protein